MSDNRKTKEEKLKDLEIKIRELVCKEFNINPDDWDYVHKPVQIKIINLERYEYDHYENVPKFSENLKNIRAGRIMRQINLNRAVSDLNLFENNVIFYENELNKDKENQ